MRNAFNNQTITEEITNSITHGIGLYLSIAALVLMVVDASKNNSSLHVISASIYGCSLIFLYTSSMLYHAFWSVRLKRIFNIFDHISIYFLIAGTYTPILLEVDHPYTRILLIIQWSLALICAILKIFFAGHFKIISTIVYLIMGWLFVFVSEEIKSALPGSFVTWIFIGGICYSVGVLFYLSKKIRFAHPIWHIFVIAGSSFHFFAIYLYVLP